MAQTLNHQGHKGSQRIAEAEASQSARLIETFASCQYVEAFAHASGRHQVLELERNFGALLGQASIFESIGELVLLANPH
jgi:antibiotic biosynthesis monooxygenase (ABM) superfamily enzyme